jgi:hypothetical protein
MGAGLRARGTRAFAYAAGPGRARPRRNAAGAGSSGTRRRPSAGGRRPVGATAAGRSSPPAGSAQHIPVSLIGRDSRVGERLTQHPVRVIEVQPVGFVVDDADSVSVGEFGRKAGRRARPRQGCSAAGALAERGFLPVPVEGIDPFLGLGARKDHLVTVEELHERGPVRPHLRPRLLDVPGIAGDLFGQCRRQFVRDLRDARHQTCGRFSSTRRSATRRDRADGNQVGRIRTRAWAAGGKRRGPCWSKRGIPGHQRDSAG